MSCNWPQMPFPLPAGAHAASLATTAATALCLCLLSFVTPANADDTGDTVRIAGSDWIMDAPTKIAAAEGWFNPAGHPGPTVEVTAHASGRDALEALMDGQADYALAAPTPVARALLNTMENPDRHPAIVVLASIGISNSSHDIIARRDRGIRTPRDLDGKRIGLLLESSAHFSWDLLASLYGLDAGTITLVDVSPPQQPAALAGGEVDAVLTWDPYATRIYHSIGDRAVVFSSNEVYAPNWLLVARRSAVQADPGLAARILAGYQRAIELIRNEPGRAELIFAAQSPAARGESEFEAHGLFWELALDWSVLANLEEQLRWWRGIEGRPPHDIPPPRSYIASAPLEEVLPHKVTLPRHLRAPANSRSAPP